MRTDVTISKDELQIFLNLQPKSIKIDYPLTNEQIATIEDEGKIYNIELHIENDLSGFSPSELWQLEQPNHSDYMQCFLASGLASYKNIENFERMDRTYENIPQDVVYAPDTNLYYNRFLSNRLIEPSRILVVESVHDEINLVLNKKYTPRHVNDLKRAAKFQSGILDEFVNGRMKQSRKAYNLALQEFLKYRNKAYAVVRTEDLTGDKERNDMVFVEGVANYGKTSNTYPVVLTSDRLLTDVCESNGVQSFLLEYPDVVNPSYCSPEKLCRLILNLAGVLGVVQVNNVLVFGEYRGRTGRDRYKLRYLSGIIPLILERDLEICRELNKLKIPF
ncbi:hypothetical protein GF319_12515 [Candidatus Bathyarchaeota archaeon]|nr:hypothetical protein [Candidatus Bathyarchaeota archaeon]